MGTIQLTTSLVLITLFTVAILGFAINFAIDNNSAVDIADDADIQNLNKGLNSSVRGFKGDSESTYNTIINSTVQPGSDTLQSPAPFTITWSNTLGFATNIFTVTYNVIFGKEGTFSIFLNTFIGLIIFIGVLYIVKTWKGAPD